MAGPAGVQPIGCTSNQAPAQAGWSHPGQGVTGYLVATALIGAALAGGGGVAGRLPAAVVLGLGLWRSHRTLAVPVFSTAVSAGGSVMEMALKAGFLAELFAPSPQAVLRNAPECLGIDLVADERPCNSRAMRSTGRQRWNGLGGDSGLKGISTCHTLWG